MQVLYWVNRIWFLWMAAIPLLWTFFRLSPHVPGTGFVMKTHFILEMMLLGHRHSQNVKTAVSKSFPSKGKSDDLHGTPTFHFQLNHCFLAWIPRRFCHDT